MPDYLDAIGDRDGEEPLGQHHLDARAGRRRNDFAPIVPALQLPKAAIRFVFPPRFAGAQERAALPQSPPGTP